MWHGKEWTKKKKKHVCWFIHWKHKALGSLRLFWDSFISYILSCWALCVMAKADTIVERKRKKRRMNVLVTHTEITIKAFHCGNKLWKCDKTKWLQSSGRVTRKQRECGNLIFALKTSRYLIKFLTSNLWDFYFVCLLFWTIYHAFNTQLLN